MSRKGQIQVIQGFLGELRLCPTHVFFFVLLRKRHTFNVRTYFWEVETSQIVVIIYNFGTIYETTLR